ncbi:hypothetical protein B0H14DRAFT_2683012 [Mycena olivaceomarginata]|nr:hypothetical protein B0H14DRAFT_2683012 [Mycena olivaceomarginata]
MSSLSTPATVGDLQATFPTRDTQQTISFVITVSTASQIRFDIRSVDAPDGRTVLVDFQHSGADVRLVQSLRASRSFPATHDVAYSHRAHSSVTSSAITLEPPLYSALEPFQMPLASSASLSIAGGSDRDSLPAYSTVAVALEASQIPPQLLVDPTTQDRATTQRTADVTCQYGEDSSRTDIVPELDSEVEDEPPELPYRRRVRAPGVIALPLDDDEVEQEAVLNSICAGEEYRSTDLRPLPLDRCQSSLLRDPLPCGGGRRPRDYDSDEEEEERYAKRSRVSEDEQWGPFRFIRSLWV